MRVRILGSSAGGGCPQWNCGCPNCRAARTGSPRHRARTQSSLALSTDDRRWFLFNASPDLRVQLAASPPLWARPGGRQSPFEAVVLTDAEMDHTLGLLSLREERLLRVYATPWVHRALSEWHPLLRVLGAYCEVEWAPVRLDAVTPLRDADAADAGLLLEAFSLAGTKAPAFAPASAVAPDMAVGYRVTDAQSGHALIYMPGVHHWSAKVEAQCASCACVLFDGTCWDEDELERLGVVGKTASAMGHLPIGGADGSLARLAALDGSGGPGGPRRVYVHLNNTNPVLDDESPERRAVEACGVEVAYDGMELEV
jgi:pyrroloquinoline quinone biosynthesis protein B